MPTAKKAKKPAKAAKAAKAVKAKKAATPATATAKPAKPTVKPPGNNTQDSAAIPSAFALFQASIQALKINTGTVVWLVVTPILASVPIFFLVVLSVFSVSAAQHGANSEVANYSVSAAIVMVYILMAIFCIYVGAALLETALHSARGQRLRYGKALKLARKKFWRFFGLALIVGSLTLGGLLLFVVPGAFVLRRYFLSPYYLLDRDLSIREAMRVSAADSQHYGGMWDMLFVVFAIGLFSVIPAVGWILSLILAVLYLCGPALRYLSYSKLDGYEAGAARPPVGDAAA